ncbi:HTH-type transcriptional repressor ComR [Streptomyces sp. RB5]|uniref:HTH-type transcriptional repressor ComR n=1 Tax=Streptomyces smaragdinus TaxID=2585196 RepID=A0A7K0CJG5_9ACTN|nr:TetR/AcrR family transcriptional regulator [Streptomyces smaragdinus]MQY13620.1 HTH-type transcriptional repressor ComR [Streptomyces smaragdinus]
MTAKQRGRPRSFDREAALKQAVFTFWEHGYEATSVADLTAAMGIAAPSLYAAFGDKRALFEEAVQVYAHAYGGFSALALTEPTARGAMERLLRDAAVEHTTPGRPRGCLIMSAGTNTNTAEVREYLRDLRIRNIGSYEERIRRGIDEGELPPGTDAGALAHYVAAVFQGMEQQARDGATREELEAVAERAMQAWPGT